MITLRKNALVTLLRREFKMDLNTFLKDRIKHLKKCEMEYFDKSVNNKFPKTVRNVYRSFSNVFEVRRHELEEYKKYMLDEKE